MGEGQGCCHHLLVDSSYHPLPMPRQLPLQVIKVYLSNWLLYYSLQVWLISFPTLLFSQPLLSKPQETPGEILLPRLHLLQVHLLHLRLRPQNLPVLDGSHSKIIMELLIILSQVLSHLSEMNCMNEMMLVLSNFETLSSNKKNLQQ